MRDWASLSSQRAKKSKKVEIFLVMTRIIRYNISCRNLIDTFET